MTLSVGDVVALRLRVPLTLKLLTCATRRCSTTGATGTAVAALTLRASSVLGWLTSARLSTMVAGVFATSAISIVLVMAARSGKLGWSGMRMWSLSLATVRASAPECGGVSVTISSAPSWPRASTSACIRLLGVAKTGGSSSPLALRRSCHFAADARAVRAQDSVVFPVPPFCDSTLTTRGRGASGGRVRVAGWMSVIGCSGARSGARASFDALRRLTCPSLDACARCRNAGVPAVEGVGACAVASTPSFPKLQ